MNFFELPIVELCLSMIIGWGLFAIILAVVHEAVVQVLAERGKFLRSQLELLLHDAANKLNWGQLIYASPMVKLMTEDARRPISDLPADVFAKALLHAFSQSHTVAAAATRDNVQSKFNDPQLQAIDVATQVLGRSDMVLLVAESLGAALRKHPNDEGKLYESVIADIMSWYTALMDRTTVRYRRRTRRRIFVLGFIVALLFNINSITLAKYFFTSPNSRKNVIAYYQKRQAMLDSLAIRYGIPISDSLSQNDSLPIIAALHRADSIRASSVSETDTAAVKVQRRPIDSLLQADVARVRDSIDRVKNLMELDTLIASNDIPIGWGHSNPYRFAYNPFKSYQTARPGLHTQAPEFPLGWELLAFLLYAFAGMLITAFAGSRGAPFWFDALRRIFSFKK